jgi:hypothetical protein
VAQALKDAGILHTNDGQFKAKYSSACLGIAKVRHYVLLLDRLGVGTEPDGAAQADPEALADEDVDAALEGIPGPAVSASGPRRGFRLEDL